MKYVRNVDDLKKYTFEFFDLFLTQSLSDQMVNYFLLDSGDKKFLELTSASALENNEVENKLIVEYGEVIMQLVDYKDLLKKYIELLLRAKRFEAICLFLNTIFLQQIGDAKYKSTRKEYNIKQRYFDRFIEIILFCQIDKNLYTPFFLAIFNCDSSSNMYDYKEPLKEYLDIYLEKNSEDNFISALMTSDNKKGLNEYANQSTIKTLQALINGFVSGEITNSNLIKVALQNHKQEGFNILEALLSSKDNEQRYKATQLLLLIRDDRRVKDRLRYIYEITTCPKIKLLLEKECNFNSLKKFATDKEFFNFVDMSTPVIQERLYGARLKRYYASQQLDNTGINGKTLTFVMETFKNKEADNQLIYLKDFFKFVDSTVLSKLANVVYDVAIYRDTLLSSKWALRLIAVFGSYDLIISMTNELDNWFNNNKTIETAKYFIDLLALCGREELTFLCKNLLLGNLDKKQKRFLENKISCLSKTSHQNLEEVKDKLVYDYDFDENGSRIIAIPNRKIKIQIESDGSLTITNAKTNKPARLSNDIMYNGILLKTYIKNLSKEIKNQKKRLFTAFLEFRNYTIESFKTCILDNPLLKYLAKNLLWGRYKKDKLAEVCALDGNQFVHLSGNLIFDKFSDYTIAILQPIDGFNQKQILLSKIGKTLFNQFDYPIFNKDDFAVNSNCIDNLNGVFCNARLFITRLEKAKYRINDLNELNEYSTLVKENKNLNLLTCVEFDKVILNHEDNSTTISKVRFFDLNKLSKVGKTFNLDKIDAKTIGEMEPHIFSNELSQIFIACKS